MKNVWQPLIDGVDEGIEYYKQRIKDQNNAIILDKVKFSDTKLTNVNSKIENLMEAIRKPPASITDVPTMSNEPPVKSSVSFPLPEPSYEIAPAPAPAPAPITFPLPEPQVEDYRRNAPISKVVENSQIPYQNEYEKVSKIVDDYLAKLIKEKKFPNNMNPKDEAELNRLIKNKFELQDLVYGKGK